MTFDEGRLATEAMYQEALTTINDSIEREMAESLAVGFAGFMLHSEAETQTVYPLYWVGNYQIGYVDSTKAAQLLNIHDLDSHLLFSSLHDGFGIGVGTVISQLKNRSLFVPDSGIKLGYSAVLVNIKKFCSSEEAKEGTIRSRLDDLYFDEEDAILSPRSVVEIMAEEDDIDSKCDLADTLLSALSCYNNTI